MKKLAQHCLIASLILFATIACTPGFQLTSGAYTLELKDATIPGNRSKEVIVTVEKSVVTIKNPEHIQVLNGMVQGKEFKVSAMEQEDHVEFVGQLTGQNQVEGKVVQNSGDNTVHTARFLLKQKAQQ